MSKLLPMKRVGERPGEPVYSLLWGVPSVAIALVALNLLTSYLLDAPVGPEGFREVVLLPDGEPSPQSRSQTAPPVAYTLPSMELLGMLAIGMGCGCLGILLGHRRGRNRKVTTCLVGTIACGAALGLSWMMYAYVAFR